MQTCCRLERRGFFGACLVTALLLVVAPSLAQAQVRLVVNGFSTVSDLPIWIAQERGMFAQQGLEVDYQQTRGSVAQFQDLMAGKYQIASTLLDNVVAYAEQQGEVKLDPPSDAFVFMGSHFGVNSVVVRSGIKRLSDMKGQAIAVDAPSTGYSFVMYSMLEKQGLLPGRDYTVVPSGGSPGRLAALKEGRAQAALMSAPADLAARSQGFEILTDTAQAFGPYQGGVYAARREWAKDHASELVRFTRAMVAAHRYVFDNRDGALEVLRKRVPALSLQEAVQVYETLTGKGGFDRQARIDVEASKAVLELRSNYSKAYTRLTDLSRYIDLRYYNEAMAAAPLDAIK